MSESNQGNPFPHKPPFKTLGKYLKQLRQKQQESLGETSGAVEIEVEKLDRFERGAELPTEDILLLLISHFELQDDEAIELWELAGYSRDSENYPFERPQQPQENAMTKAMQITLVAMDNRVLHTNGVEIDVDASGGVVLNFSHSGGGQPPYTVSRVGMSTQQAQQLLESLQRSLLHQKYLSGPKALPDPKSSDRNKSDK